MYADALCPIHSLASEKEAYSRIHTYLPRCVFGTAVPDTLTTTPTKDSQHHATCHLCVQHISIKHTSPHMYHVHKCTASYGTMAATYRREMLEDELFGVGEGRGARGGRRLLVDLLDEDARRLQPADAVRHERRQLELHVGEAGVEGADVYGLQRRTTHSVGLIAC